MPFTYKVTLKPPLRTVRGKFSKAHAVLNRERRNMMRNQGRRLVALAKDEAPGDEFPKSIKFRTSDKGKGNLSLALYHKEPLGTFITEGTKKHPIVAVNAKALRFYWPKGGFGKWSPSGAGKQKLTMHGGMHMFKKVNHPGTKPNRYVRRARKRWMPGARKDLSAAAKKYVEVLNTR